MKNSWYDEVVAMYGGDEEAVAAVVRDCLERGEVHCDANGFIAGYKTRSPKSVDKSDTWFIYIAVGNLKRIFNSSERMAYVAYERNDGKLRYVPMDRFERIMK